VAITAAKNILVSAVRDATNSTPVQHNVEAVDPVDGTYYNLLTGPAIVGTGTTILKIHPNLAAVANESVNDILPQGWRVTCTHSAASDFTYSISVNWV